jgi:hypothetical protein
MGSMRWIHNILIEGERSSIEIMLGTKQLGDRCNVRINQEPEIWFNPYSSDKHEILSKGKDILKKRLQGKALTFLDGAPFDWD